MREKRFNLVDERWVPVVGNRLLSLREVFCSSENTMLSGNAVEKIVMLRLLLAIAHAAIEIDDDASWLSLTNQGISASVVAYLEKWHDAFDLYGEHPFLQVPQLGHLGKTSSLSALQPNISSGNKPVLTHWNLPVELSDAEIARLILRSVCFACGGKRFDNSIVLTPGYVGKKNEKGKPSTGVAGTLLGQYGYLHSYLLGDSILETVHLNMLTREDCRQILFGEIGRPCWEEMPDGEASQRAVAYQKSYQGQLLPLDKYLLVRDDGIVMTDGIKYKNHLSGMVDPAMTIKKDKDKTTAVLCKPECRPWRELDSILMFLNGNEQVGPFTIAFGKRKLPSSYKMIRVWSGGAQVSANSGEQFFSGYNDYLESELLFPTEHLNSEGLIHYSEMMNDLKFCSKVLFSAVKKYYSSGPGETKGDLCADMAKRAESRYWEEMEKEAQRIIDIAFGDMEEARVQEMIRKCQRCALRVYTEICPNETARQISAWAENEPRFKMKQK